jgi:hypothetical protein
MLTFVWPAHSLTTFTCTPSINLVSYLAADSQVGLILETDISQLLPGAVLHDSRRRFLIPARNRMAVRILRVRAASAACGASACAVFCATCATLPQSTAAHLGKL